ncbi:sigma-70 family RNA polymerase sigma factor [Streptomyces chromofuscus]|uniref:Sigma-70 family RNA polymerase sigma factor n=1 Tax=Streptomyces chromofuscus TaxID=42881 RepID=A0A7M2THH4_STRCW|nr:sigma-70 family RNA polymerase sigma factor [Streptomyces chromofuscus]QOV47629.1 sigma-70 family RNA polymerase sigma factor [Streptomyces chromofuscus]GGT25231.1 DNA-directed RNA polymerase sigma-70 factor [Streptomyces chromofuscus]
MRGDHGFPDDHDFLAERFEAHRTHLRAVAHRMLGSLAEADDAVQEAWFRLSRSDTREVDNLGGWLTTVVGRVCLDMLRSRKSRAEESLDQSPDHGAPAPAATAPDPEHDALLADSVGVALLVVLDTLTPAERLAFVLHDMFAVPYDEVARIVGRTPTAARQLASRARRRVRGAPAPDADLARQREVVDAFRAAARDGDFDGLLRVLDPDVVSRSAFGVVVGAAAVASGARTAAHLARVARPALVDGVPGLAVLSEDGQRLVQALRFTFVRGRIAVIDIVTDPERLSRLDVTLP